MVIHEETLGLSNEQSDLGATERGSVKHHVCKVTDRKIIENVTMSSTDDEKREKKKKSAKKSKNKTFTPVADCTEVPEVTEISKADLEELRSVYTKCKTVMKKIESKYGHLLNFKEPGSRKRRKNESDSLNSDLDVCECTVNKKIIFDDEGKEIMIKTDLDNHICPKKLKRRHSMQHVNVNIVQVEYEAVDTTLPNDIRSLTNILHNQEIETTYRNKVIHKIKMLRQEYADEIRFNKLSLIEKSKSNPEEILDFKGTNLKTLPGYKT